MIGDIGGHLAALRAQLAALGVPDAGAGPLPPDLLVIQVGDLVHRGPDSAGVVALVDDHLRRQPGQWTQLLGNHELHSLRREQFHWPTRLPRDTVGVLRDWWRRGLLRVAASFRVGGEAFLVTHAGLTHDFWSSVLGGPADVEAVVGALNGGSIPARTLFRTGSMVGGGSPQPLAGPIWAAAGRELVPGWHGHPLPFSQLHGHYTVRDWGSGRWYLPEPLRPLAELDADARHVTVRLEGGRLIGVDAGDAALRRGEGLPWVAPGVLH